MNTWQIQGRSAFLMILFSLVLMGGKGASMEEPAQETAKPRYLVIHFHGQGQSMASAQDQIGSALKQLAPRVFPQGVDCDFDLLVPDSKDWGHQPGLWFPFPTLSDLSGVDYAKVSVNPSDLIALGLNVSLDKLAGATLDVGKLIQLMGMPGADALLKRVYPAFEPVLHRVMGPSIAKINKQIDEALRVRNMSSRNLILSGYSLGAITALSASLARQEPCKAVVTSSGFWFGTEIVSHPETMFLAFGAKDQILPSWIFELSTSHLQGVLKGTNFESSLDPDAGHDGLTQVHAQKLAPFLKDSVFKK